MSKASELLEHRKNRDTTIELRKFESIKNAQSLESYYESILTDEDVEKALEEYNGNYNAVNQEFIEKTKLQRVDIPFLFLATALQCLRIYVINRITAIEKANVKGGKEDAIHKFQDKILGNFNNGMGTTSSPLYASLDAIITTRGVPYDAQSYFDVELKNMKLFKGANHRFSTPGHDPILGLIFGTANILTNTITTNHGLAFTTNHVLYDSNLKNPKLGLPTSTINMLNVAVKRFEDDKASVVAAVIKQLMHIATDLYTPCGIQLPGASLVLSNTNVEKLTRYISTGDAIKIGASASISVLINTIVSAVHGCKLIFDDDGSNYSTDLYQVRTNKIIDYSNLIASTSNIISTAVSGDVSGLDIGGLAVTICRLFNDIKFITKLQYEYVNSGISKIYDERYSEIDKYYR